MSPTRPRCACPVCRRLDCTNAAHKPKAFATSQPTRQRRPAWEQTRKRRAAAVAAWRAQYGDTCPKCGREGVKLTADHPIPVALGGSEWQELEVMCLDCAHRQAGRVGNEVKRRRRASGGY